MNPKSTTLVDQLFGSDLLPKDIPDHYKDMSRPSVFIICLWHYHNQDIRLAPFDKTAFDHIRSCLNKHDLDHDRKITGCAYLLDQFFKTAIWQNTFYHLGV